MSSILESAINGFNGFITEQRTEEGDALVSTYMFNSRYEKFYENIDVKECQLLSTSNFIPSGTTALYDAIGYTIDGEIDMLGILPIEKRPFKTLCVILTDGYENASTNYTNEKIKKMILEMKKDFGWEFIFLAANEDATTTAVSMGISSSNSYVWSNDQDGVKDAYRGVNYATTSFRSSVMNDTDMSYDSSTLMDEFVKTKSETK